MKTPALLLLTLLCAAVLPFRTAAAQSPSDTLAAHPDSLLTSAGASCAPADTPQAQTDTLSALTDSLLTQADYLHLTAIADSIALDARLTADNIIDEAMKYLGTPYRSAGKGPTAFDCSGFTGYVFRQFGYHLSASSRIQCNDGREVPPPFDNLQKGDLLIFGARGETGTVGHVGIYIAPDEDGDGFTFIHAAVHGGVIISNIKEDYYSRRYLGARRILPDFTRPAPSLSDFE